MNLCYVLSSIKYRFVNNIFFKKLNLIVVNILNINYTYSYFKMSENIFINSYVDDKTNDKAYDINKKLDTTCETLLKKNDNKLTITVLKYIATKISDIGILEKTEEFIKFHEDYNSTYLQIAEKIKEDRDKIITAKYEKLNRELDIEYERKINRALGKDIENTDDKKEDSKIIPKIKDINKLKEDLKCKGEQCKTLKKNMENANDCKEDKYNEEDDNEEEEDDEEENEEDETEKKDEDYKADEEEDEEENEEEEEEEEEVDIKKDNEYPYMGASKLQINKVMRNCPLNNMPFPEYIYPILFKLKNEPTFRKIMSIDYSDDGNMESIEKKLKSFLSYTEYDEFIQKYGNSNVDIYNRFLYEECCKFIREEDYEEDELYSEIKKSAIGKKIRGKIISQFYADDYLPLKIIDEDNFDSILAHIPNCVRAICDLPCVVDNASIYKSKIYSVGIILRNFNKMGLTTTTIIKFMDEFIKYMDYELSK